MIPRFLPKGGGGAMHPHHPQCTVRHCGKTAPGPALFYPGPCPGRFWSQSRTIPGPGIGRYWSTGTGTDRGKIEYRTGTGTGQNFGRYRYFFVVSKMVLFIKNLFVLEQLTNIIYPRNPGNDDTCRWDRHRHRHQLWVPTPTPNFFSGADTDTWNSGTDTDTSYEYRLRHRHQKFFHFFPPILHQLSAHRAKNNFVHLLNIFQVKIWCFFHFFIHRHQIFFEHRHRHQKLPPTPRLTRAMGTETDTDTCNKCRHQNRHRHWCRCRCRSFPADSFETLLGKNRMQRSDDSAKRNPKSNRNRCRK